MEIIYNEFYKGKEIDNGNYDCHEEFGQSPIGIGRFYQRYHKSESKTIASGRFDVLTIGDKLPEDHIQFLRGLRVTA